MMGKRFLDLIEMWPRFFIQDSDLALLMGKSRDARYSAVKRALQKGTLVRIKRGLYLITGKAKRMLIDEFEFALLIYGPSFISFESALSYHGWIPEGVYTITCASPKRLKVFETPIGTFIYKRVPVDHFYTGVERIATKEGAVFIATPWRAIADFMYTRRKSWQNLVELEHDLRIDKETLAKSKKTTLKSLIENYPSRRVCAGLKRLLLAL